MAIVEILSKRDIKRFDVPPVFDKNERNTIFKANKVAQDYLDCIRTPEYKVGFLLQYGYFIISRRFYVSEVFYQTDISHVLFILGVKTKFDPKFYDKNTRKRHRAFILEMFAWKAFSTEEKDNLIDYTNQQTKGVLNSKSIFSDLVRYLNNRKTELPTYATFSKIISKSLLERERLLLKTINDHFSPNAQIYIDELLSTDLDISKIDDTERSKYKISFLKTINKESTPGAIVSNIERIKKLKVYYVAFRDLIETLDLNIDGFKYYSDYVSKIKFTQMKQMTDDKIKLHLISFIYIKFFELNDILTVTLLKEVRANTNLIQRKYDELNAQLRMKDAVSTKTVLWDIQTSVFPLQLKVLNILVSDGMTDGEKVTKALTAYEEESEIIKKAEVQVHDQYNRILDTINEVDKFSIIEKLSLKLQRRVTQIILNLEFEYKSSSELLSSAIRYFKKNNGDIDDACPQGFLAQKERSILYNDKGKFRISLYKSFLIQHAAKAIKSGSLNILNSMHYKEFEAFLITEKEWKADKKKYLDLSGLSNLSDSRTVLDELKIRLQKQYETTNTNIENGENKHIKFNEDGTFVIRTDPLVDGTFNRLADIVPNSLSVNIGEVMTAVNNHAKFTDEMKHFTNRHVPGRPCPETLIAAIVALGCGVGLSKMNKISRNLTGDLEQVATLYFSDENLQNANDVVLKMIGDLPISKIYGDPSETHTSSDGSKYNVILHTLDTTKSFKYHLSGHGISVYVFIDQSHRMFYSTVINSSEREAAYVIDGLMHNDVVQSDIHSTDTHGFSEVIYATTHLLGYRFAPRIKNLKKQYLYSFSSPNTHKKEGNSIRPKEILKVDLIEEYWDLILRFTATIKLKRAKASDLFRRLNSYSEHSPFYKALKEFGRIIKTLGILDYLDNHELRQKIEKQQNRVESVQKFARGVLAYGKYDFSSGIREEQLLIEGAKRLVQNSVLAWNYLYVSNKIASANSYYEKSKILALAQKGSPIFWKHLNFFGTYDYSPESLKCKFDFDYRALKALKI